MISNVTLSKYFEVNFSSDKHIKKKNDFHTFVHRSDAQEYIHDKEFRNILLSWLQTYIYIVAVYTSSYWRTCTCDHTYQELRF
jgi:hypothetical protein